MFGGRKWSGSINPATGQNQMTKLTIATVAIFFMTASAPALAGEAWQVGNSSYHLYFSDLDLHTVSGRAEALKRVEASAAKLCGAEGVVSEQRACIAKTVANVSQGSAAPALQLALSERSSWKALAQAR